MPDSDLLLDLNGGSYFKETVYCSTIAIGDEKQLRPLESSLMSTPETAPFLLPYITLSQHIVSELSLSLHGRNGRKTGTFLTKVTERGNMRSLYVKVPGTCAYTHG